MCVTRADIIPTHFDMLFTVAEKVDGTNCHMMAKCISRGIRTLSLKMFQTQTRNNQRAVK